MTAMSIEKTSVDDVEICMDLDCSIESTMIDVEYVDLVSPGKTYNSVPICVTAALTAKIITLSPYDARIDPYRRWCNEDEYSSLSYVHDQSRSAVILKPPQK